ncbi:MAG: T9SS type A sorting domain-containing protein [Sphingobacteriales bacterium]|nr:MAG: T9SS type A sorting domain-containing protein [Sphingobacteriales bacterium]
MKPIFSLLTFLCLSLCAAAQTDPVWLLDENGFFISTHNSIGSAYAAIPASISHSYTIQIQNNYTDTTEHYPIVFTSKAGASSNNKIKITGSFAPFKFKRIDSTDCFVFDDADWIEFEASFSWNIMQHPTKQLFHFKNGASNNIVRNFYINEATFFDPAQKGHYFYFGKSPTNTEGNSNNIIEHCTFFGTTGECIASEGSLANPNCNNIIRNNDFLDYRNAINARSGTSGISIDSNHILVFTQRGYTRGIIDLDSISGNVYVTRNTITMKQDSGNIAGIYIRATGTNQLHTANNMIQTRADSFVSDRKYLFPYEDIATNLSGIWIDGTEQTSANVYHNTVVVKGTYDPLYTTTMTSSAFRRTENNTGSIYDIRNNILLNHRAGGGSNAAHVALDMRREGAITINHNFYNSHTGIAMLNGIPYNTWTDYKTEASKTNANESASDSVQISFTRSGFNLHLSSDVIGNSSIYGATLPSVTDDIDGHPRTVYYRGADEYTIACPSTLVGGTIGKFVGDSCLGHYQLFHASGSSQGKDGVENQWQTRPWGSGLPFTDIPGARGTTKADMYMPFQVAYSFIQTLSGAHEYRLKTSCISSGDSAFSNTAIVYARPTPQIDSIVAKTSDGFKYTFSLLGDTAGHYYWDMGDGNPGMGEDTVTHTYKSAVTHTVRVIVGNYFFCGFDTFYRTIQVGVGVKDIASAGNIRLYPNPASDHLTVNLPEGTPYIITDLTGRAVLQSMVRQETIDVRSLTPGAYIISFTIDGNAPIHSRFIRE